MSKVGLIILVTLLSGCARTGFNKQCTLMPDEVWVAHEGGQTADNFYDTIKIQTGLKWKLQ